MRYLLALFAAAALATPAGAAEPERVTEIVRGQCSLCHGELGESSSPVFPRLAGQHADYTKAQLVTFRQGERTNSAQMASIAANLSDKEIEALSDYIAGLR